MWLIVSTFCGQTECIWHPNDGQIFNEVKGSWQRRSPFLIPPFEGETEEHHGKLWQPPKTVAAQHVATQKAVDLIYFLLLAFTQRGVYKREKRRVRYTYRVEKTLEEADLIFEFPPAVPLMTRQHSQS